MYVLGLGQKKTERFGPKVCLENVGFRLWELENCSQGWQAKPNREAKPYQGLRPLLTMWVAYVRF